MFEALFYFVISVGTITLQNNLEKILVVKGAENVKYYRIEDRIQISYTMNKKFPNITIKKETWRTLSAYGWLHCNPSNSEWESFYDATTKSAIKRNIMYWRNTNMLLTILQEHKGANQNRQHVTILLDSYKEKDIDNVLFKLTGSNCLMQSRG